MKVVKTYTLNEALEELQKDNKVEEKLCEDKEAGEDLAEYQKWVDYDMKKYGRISLLTKKKIAKAGLEIIKDDHGDYEVIAKEDGGIDESLNEEAQGEEKYENLGARTYLAATAVNKAIDTLMSWFKTYPMDKEVDRKLCIILQPEDAADAIDAIRTLKQNLDSLESVLYDVNYNPNQFRI